MLKTIQDLWEEGRKTLPLNAFPEREEELLLIFLEILNIPRHELSLYRQKTITITQQKRFFSILNERKTFKPLAYILGFQYFYGRKFPVSSETLIPRFDTEILVESVTKYINTQQSIDIIDICTGTGVIALTLAYLFPNAKIKGTDIVSNPFIQSQQALNLTNKNITFSKQDFLDSSLWEGLWDCVISNPPYLDETDMQKLDPQVSLYEPHSALYAPEEGLIFYHKIIEFCGSHLKNGGYLFLEIDHKYPKIISALSETQFEPPIIVPDLAGLPRVLVVKKKA